MSENSSPSNNFNLNTYNISQILKKLFKKENFIRPFIIFFVIYLFGIVQNWGSIIFFLFPIITFGFFIFFKVIEVSKEYTNVKGSNLSFNPIGDEGVIANRLFFCSLLELIIVFAMGTESLYHPQLINNYFIFYVLPVVLIYIFSIYYSFYDLGMNATIVVALNSETSNNIRAGDIDAYLTSNRKEKEFTIPPSEEQPEKINNLESKSATQRLISHLSVENYAKIFNMVKIITILFAVNWILWLLLTYFNLIPGVNFGLPGSSFIEGTDLEVTFLIFVCLVGIPVCFVWILTKTYQLNTQIDLKSVQLVIKEFPISQQQKVVKLLEVYFSKNEDQNKKGKMDNF
jgi:hypothetical protein